MRFKLNRINQCAKCPWKKSTDPREIPNGYCETKHANLKVTISEGHFDPNLPLHAMACHESGKEEQYCVGWLHNQLGRGNNIALRLRMLNCDNIRHIKLDGEQHDTFEDTLPK